MVTAERQLQVFMQLMPHLELRVGSAAAAETGLQLRVIRLCPEHEMAAQRMAGIEAGQPELQARLRMQLQGLNEQVKAMSARRLSGLRRVRLDLNRQVQVTDAVATQLELLDDAEAQPAEPELPVIYSDGTVTCSRQIDQGSVPHQNVGWFNRAFAGRHCHVPDPHRIIAERGSFPPDAETGPLSLQVGTLQQAGRDVEAQHRDGAAETVPPERTALNEELLTIRRETVGTDLPVRQVKRRVTGVQPHRPVRKQPGDADMHGPDGPAVVTAMNAHAVVELGAVTAAVHREIAEVGGCEILDSQDDMPVCRVTGGLCQLRCQEQHQHEARPHSSRPLNSARVPGEGVLLAANVPAAASFAGRRSSSWLPALAALSSSRPSSYE